MKPKFTKRVSDIDISGIRKMFEGAGTEAINLGLGQPDFDTPEHIKKAAIDAIKEGFTGYTIGTGIPELRQAISEKFKKENNIEVSPEEIMVTSGASEALHIALEALVQSGDEVLVPDPGFVSYSALTKIADGKVIGVPLEDLKMSPDTVSEYLTDKTKVLVINSPSNPTGMVQTKYEIKGFADLAEDHNITIISDEVYEHFIYEGEHVSAAQFTEKVITINAVSKTYAMTGWRLGYLAANSEYLEQMLKVHQYVQACANSISQKAALAALTGPQNCVIEMGSEFRKRRDLLLKGFKEIGIKCIEPKGAFYAFPEVYDGLSVAEKCIKNGVIVVPGSAFGNAPNNIRVSYAASRDNIKRGLEIMERIL